MNIATCLAAKQALLPSGWASDVRVHIGEDGRIASVQSNVPPEPDDQVLSDRALLPAPSNLHSHAFQRAIAGLTESRTSTGDFWSWREAMFAIVARLSPDDMEGLAALVQMEMLEAGYAAVGEFHYLHHQPDGRPYDDPGATGAGIASAASTTGIGLTLLPVLYRRGGLDDRPLSGGQRAFGCTPDLYEAVLASCRSAVSRLPPDCNIGVAPHSLRTVSPDDLSWLIKLSPEAPIHIHIAEQIAEVDAVVAMYGARPVEWLLDTVDVDQHWCLVHATHMSEAETTALATTGAVVGLCPITEANLGDGVFAGARFIAEGGRFGVGSDSNVRIACAEELRALEYSQRLSMRRRAILTRDGWSVGRTLFEAAVSGGAQALGRDSGAIAEGRFADLVGLDTGAIATTGLDGDRLLDAWIFASDDRLVRDVWSAGRHVVVDGNHIERERITEPARTTLERLRSDL